MPGTPPPANVVATAGSTGITVSWSRTSPGTFNLYRSLQSGAESPPAYQSGLTNISYLDVNVVAGTVYYYRVTTVNNGMESIMSNEAFAAAT